MATTAEPTLAVISLANFEERKQEIAEELYKSATHDGFFYIVDHGIPQADIDRAFAHGTEFFNLPEETKAKSQFDPDTYIGWRGLNELENVSGTKLWEWLSLGYDRPENTSAQARFPAEELTPGFKDFSQRFMDESHEVALKILRALAISLKLPEDYFLDVLDKTADDNGSFLAFNHYPPTKSYWKEGDSNRLHAHADTTMITLVYQRPGEVGLECSPGRETKPDPRVGNDDLTGAWAGIPSNLNAFVPASPLGRTEITVNIGDILMRWSDDILKSTYHRVRVPEELGKKEGNALILPERRSVAYFTMPRRSALVQGPQKKYPLTTAGEIIAKEGNAYEAKKNDTEWQKIAYQKDAPVHVALPLATQAVAVK